MSSETPVLTLVRPTQQSTTLGNTHTTPVKVLIQSPALLQLIESVYQYKENDETKSRVIGTLLGVRSDDGSILEVKDCYIVPHKEEDEELTIEEAFHISNYHLYKKLNPELSILGWFSTNPILDGFTGLFHEFYSKGNEASCFPHQAIHLTIQSKDENGDIISPIIKTYISSQVGVSSTSFIANKLNIDKIGSFAFTPIENEISINSPAELTTLSWINKASLQNGRTVNIPSNNNTELIQVSDSLNKLTNLIDTVSNYVDKVINGEIQGDAKVGKFLLNNLTSKANSLSSENLDKLFNSHIQDTLLIEYLASSVKTQLDLSAKLTAIVQGDN